MLGGISHVKQLSGHHNISPIPKEPALPKLISINTYLAEISAISSSEGGYAFD
jgi:hypothetical protein